MKIKLNPVKKLIEGKRLVVVDDSIVRGTTSKKIIKMIRNGRGRGPYADQFTADYLSLLLRRRHTDTAGTYCIDAMISRKSENM